MEDAEDVTHTIESCWQQVPVCGTQQLENLEKTPNTSDELMAPNVMNVSTSSSNLGSSLLPGFHAKNKNSLKPHRNVKPQCPIDDEHSLGVEGRLNSLLDQNGGISRKDSTDEYLRLLLETSADGDAGGTSKSIRDVALILEALLHTKSRDVLMDIINLNGLHMLHNILKQNRDHFLKRPILRKLLKVLEFLALRGILTAEKINEAPRHAGMESFRDLMLKLTRHSDKHVHPIARKFCDKWILPYMDGSAPGVPFNPCSPLSIHPQRSSCRPSTSPTQISCHDGASNSSAYRGRGVERGGRVHRSWRNGGKN